MRILRALVFSAALLPFASLAHAQQVAVYGAVDYTESGFTYNGNTLQYKPGDPGFTLGGFYNFPIDSRLTAGIDLRNTYSPGIKGGDAASVNLRIAFVPRKARLRPFFQIGGGVVSSTTTVEIQGYSALTGSQRYTNGSANLDLGLDIRLTDSLDLRALDWGAQTGGTVVMAYANIGVVYHFPKKN